MPARGQIYRDIIGQINRDNYIQKGRQVEDRKVEEGTNWTNKSIEIMID